MMNYGLVVNPEVPLPIHVQVMEQIKWFIVLGFMKPGEVLIPAAQLADLLQVNRNTVQAVYAQLREEGILDTRKGYGTWVADSEQTHKLIEERKPLGQFMEQTFEEALKSGLDRSRFVNLSAASVQLQLKYNTEQFMFIVSKEEEYRFLHEEIVRLTGREAEPLFVEGLADMENSSQSSQSSGDVMVTTLSCVEEVRRLYPNAADSIIIVEPVIDQFTFFEIAHTIKTSRTGFVSGGKRGVDWINSQIAASSADYISLTINEQDKIVEMLGVVEQVYAAPSVYDSVRRLAPDKVKRLNLQLEKSSEFQLKSFSGDRYNYLTS
ncbi:GntR family transcriptional regulator [Cohnella abietis]|uniref:HTH gntR-type domain-containing protein n=1 Tax=Cohnella abietis TaxID=2507935 RepID=A0A3T1DC32_9BACL|nr:GntR family transcriptional regulator [Cohnella abietis]BBI35518.1 hypothetical protein KCTCHS21_49170 [Cohnella abietis]